MSKDLGKSTSYAYYVDAGGTKTPQEYGEMLVNIDTVATRAEDAADAAAESATGALNSKNAAQTAATTATNKATEATTAATTATTKAGEASTSASTATSAKDTAVSASQTATTKATEATTAAATATSAKTDAVAANTAAQSAKTAAQTAQTGAETAAASVQSSAAQIATNTEDISQLKSDFADMQSDGVVPSAEQILTDKGITDSVPYHYRKTGGDGADRLYDQIVGGTVCWNQLASSSVKTTINGITFNAEADGYLLNGTASAKAYAILFSNASFISGHRYLMLDDGDKATYGFSLNTELPYQNQNYFVTGGNLTLAVAEGTTLTNVKVHPQVFDLTAMLGTTIADYIYSLETAHTGDGVAFFKALFPNDYYPYNAGELKSVEGVSAHKTVGFNQFDEVLESGVLDVNGANAVNTEAIRSKNYIPVFGGQSYCFTLENNTYVRFRYYDTDKSFIGLFEVNASTANGYVFTTPSNARYMRFWVLKNSANSDFCINLSDPAKNGTYEPYKAHSYPLDSTVELRGIPKLDNNNKLYFDGDVYEYTGEVTRNTILRAYQSGDESLANAITDGTNTVVYSANASTEQADPYQHLQQCDPNGTEEYISTGIVPVGHNSFYPENLRAKVEGLPWNFANLIAPTESAFVATRNYTTGSLFIVDNVLYKATSNIANGGTITPNTNCTATTLAEIISALA